MICRSVILCRFILTRGISTTAAKMQQPSLIKLKKLQAQFQAAISVLCMYSLFVHQKTRSKKADDGKLVWQKGGFKDRVLYMTTWVLIAIGLTMTFGFIWDCIKPPQWKQQKEE